MNRRLFISVLLCCPALKPAESLVSRNYWWNNPPPLTKEAMARALTEVRFLLRDGNYANLDWLEG